MAVNLPTLSELVVGTELEHAGPGVPASHAWSMPRCSALSLAQDYPRYRLLNSLRSSYALAHSARPTAGEHACNRAMGITWGRFQAGRLSCNSSSRRRTRIRSWVAKPSVNRS